MPKIQRQRRKILWIFSYLTVVWNWTLLNGNTTNSVVKLDQQGTRCCYVSNFSPNCMNFQFCIILFFPRQRRHVIVQVSNFNYSGLSSPCFFFFLKEAIEVDCSKQILDLVFWHKISKRPCPNWKQFFYRLFKRVLYILNKTVLVLKAKIFRWISSRTLIYGIQKRAVLLKHAFLASAFKLCCKHFLFRLASRSRWIWTTHHGTRI